MDLLEKAGICGFAGKVCMDRNCPDDYREEDARTSPRRPESGMRL